MYKVWIDWGVNKMGTLCKNMDEVMEWVNFHSSGILAENPEADIKWDCEKIPVDK